MTADAKMPTQPESQPTEFAIKVIAVGDGGSAIVDQMFRGSVDTMLKAALNTASAGLGSLSISEKQIIGLKHTRGLGCGGDPLMGRAAAEADIELIRKTASGADLVLLVSALGGGTGSGATPVVARVAREAGALVMAIVTLPFEFEGSRRRRQAADALELLKTEADSVLCLPNQRLFELIDASTPYHDTFKLTHKMVADGVLSFYRLLTQRGLIAIGFADLCAVTRGRHTESVFACEECGGEGRAERLLSTILTHPLLERGQVLAQASSVLVSLRGGSDMTMAEVNQVMERINQECEPAEVTFGALEDPALEGRIGLTVVVTRQSPGHVNRNEPLPQTPRVEQKNAEAEKLLDGGLFGGESPATRPPSRFVAPPPAFSEQEKVNLYQKQAGAGRKRPMSSARQTQLQLDIVSRGRFEKSEPTIHHGEDLDVPTYIRRGIHLN